MNSGGAAAGWDVYLAYSSPDRARAQALFDALTGEGLKVCFDQAVLRPGDDWHRLLPAHVRASMVVVALISPHLDDAHFARSEVVRAIDQVRRGKHRLVPVRLVPDGELPYGTDQLHAIDLFADEDAAEVAKQISGVIDDPASPQVPTAKIFCDRVPVPPRFFAGREAQLADLQKSAREGATSVLTQTIQGLGGVGKTSLAAALVEARNPELDVVWWVRAEHPSVLVADLAELAAEVGLAGNDEASITAARARRWLEHTDQRWLVVFDNAPDEASVEPWLPKRGAGSVIVTSRSRIFRVGDVVPVDIFSPDVAEEFLRHRVEAANPAAAAGRVDLVVDRLQGLPLALEQAAAWVERVPNRRFDRFAQLFDDAARDPFPEGTRPLGYEHTATTTWRVSIRAAVAEAPLAERLMAALAFFAPDDIPCQWFRDQADDDYLESAGVEAVDEALDALHGYSLAQIDAEDNISVHRVIQRVTRQSAPDGAHGFAIRTLRAQILEDPDNPLRWPAMALVVPHALALRPAADVPPEHAHDLWQIADAVATYQRESGAVADAVTNADLASELAIRHRGPDHPDALLSRNNLARAHLRAGNPCHAMALFEAIVADRGRVLGLDHVDTLMSRHDLAFACDEAGDQARATRLDRAVLADRERVLGPDHLDTLTTRVNLAAAHRAAGDVVLAVSLGEALLADAERVLGSNHPCTLTARNNLAAAYQAAGDVVLAVSLNEAVLADRERVLGSNHPCTLTARHNLAAAYLDAAEVAQAMSLGEAVLVDRERVLGPDHLDTLLTRESLAVACRAACEWHRAVVVLEGLVVARERVLGPDHPETKAARSDRGKARIARARLRR